MIQNLINKKNIPKVLASLLLLAEIIFPAEGLERRKSYRKSKLTSDESEAISDRRLLLLTVGEDKTVDLSFEANAGVNGISVGNPQLVANTLVKIGEKRQIVFKPLKAGETTVTVRDLDGTLRLIFIVRVTGSNLFRVKAELGQLLRDIEGLEIRIVGSKIVLEGELLVPSDYGRLLTVIRDKAYLDFILNLTTLSPYSLQSLSKRIQQDIQAFAPNVKTRVVNGVVFLEGTVDNADQAKRANEVALYYLPDLRPGNPLELDPSAQRMNPPRSLVRSFIIINPPAPKKQEKQVRVTVHFVVLSKDYNRVFSFKWQPGFTSDPQISVGQTAVGAAGAATPSFSATLSSLFPKLQTAQAAGFARVLQTGTIFVRSGQPAKFSRQTQFPFFKSGPNGQVTSESKGVGVSLALTPLILGQSDDIQMDLDLEQSDLVGVAPTGTAPVTSVHKVSTKIYVKSSESAAVAGITSSDVGTDFNKNDPKPGEFDAQTNTDTLFSLLRSKNYRKQKSQFVIFVTPQIIENASEGTEDLKKNFRIKVK